MAYAVLDCVERGGDGMNVIYNAAYKCRICGGVLIDQQTANADIARDCVFHQNFDASLWPHNSGVKPPFYASHGCDDGSIGLADFIGMGATEA